MREKVEVNANETRNKAKIYIDEIKNSITSTNGIFIICKYSMTTFPIILRKQKKEKEYQDQYEDYNLESSPNLPGSDKKKKEVTKNNRRKGYIYESLGNDEKRVPLGIEKYIFEPI